MQFTGGLPCLSIGIYKNTGLENQGLPIFTQISFLVAPAIFQ